MKWQYQGVAGAPILSRTAARQIRDISLRSVDLFREAIRKHGPIPGYVRSLQAVGQAYTNARRYLEKR